MSLNTIKPTVGTCVPQGYYTQPAQVPCMQPGQMNSYNGNMYPINNQWNTNAILGSTPGQFSNSNLMMPLMANNQIHSQMPIYGQNWQYVGPNYGTDFFPTDSFERELMNSLQYSPFSSPFLPAQAQPQPQQQQLMNKSAISTWAPLQQPQQVQQQSSHYRLWLPLEQQAKPIERLDEIRLRLNSTERELDVDTESIHRTVKLPEWIELNQLKVRLMPAPNNPTQQVLLIEAPYKYAPIRGAIDAGAGTLNTIEPCAGSPSGAGIISTGTQLPIERQYGGLLVKKYFQQLEQIFGSSLREGLIKMRCVPVSSFSSEVEESGRFQIELELMETKHFMPQQVQSRVQQRKNKLTGLDETVVRVEAKRALEFDGSAQEVVREFVLPQWVCPDLVRVSAGPCDGKVLIVLPCDFYRCQSSSSAPTVAGLSFSNGGSTSGPSADKSASALSQKLI